MAAVSLLNKIGVASAREYLQKTGIELDDRDWNLSLALGAMTVLHALKTRKASVPPRGKNYPRKPAPRRTQQARFVRPARKEKAAAGRGRH